MWQCPLSLCESVVFICYKLMNLLEIWTRDAVNFAENDVLSFIRARQESFCADKICYHNSTQLPFLGLLAQTAQSIPYNI